MISKLKEMRLKRNMTQEELAKESKVSLKQIQKYETDFSSFCSCMITTSKRIAKALDCQVEELIPYADIIAYENLLKSEKQSP